MKPKYNVVITNMIFRK